MELYRERLWPAPWIFIATALVIPASLLVFLPINTTVGIVVAIGLYVAIVITLVVTSPTITVTDTTLTAGRAAIERDLIGAAEPFDREEATLERGQRLDARAWLLIRGWLTAVVRVRLDDPDDPTPYWLLSTRRPTELSEVLSPSRVERS